MKKARRESVVKDRNLATKYKIQYAKDKSKVRDRQTHTNIKECRSKYYAYRRGTTFDGITRTRKAGRGG